MPIECAVFNAAAVRSAPVLIAMATQCGCCGYERDGSFIIKKEDRWQYFDAGIACQTFCLAAHELGLATVILGIYDEEKLPTFLGLQEDEVLTALIALGYADTIPAAPKRKNVDELLRYLLFDMRRKDREITDRQSIIDIIGNCQCCRIGFYDDGEVYIVPLNFGVQYNEEHLVFYFHGAKEGRKINLIEKSPHVGFEMDTNHEVYTKSDNEFACVYTARFQSIIGTGKISMVHDADEKKQGLSLLMKHTTQKCEWPFDDKMLNAVAVFKLEVERLSCKVHE